jgi:lipoyl(octanoyl) transferase
VFLQASSPGQAWTATGQVPVLHIYSLGLVPFETALGLQKRLVYEISGDRSQAALVLCEHPPLITIGRQGSFVDVLLEPRQLVARCWQVRWVNRGGGSMLHLPGQLAIYPIFPLDSLGLGIQAYLERLQQVLLEVLAEWEIAAQPAATMPGVRVGQRLIAGIGVAIRDWVSYYGIYFNIHTPLEPFRWVRCQGERLAMTSLERERHRPTRLATVRQQVLEQLVQQFGFTRTAFFSNHPALNGKSAHDAFSPLG